MDASSPGLLRARARLGYVLVIALGFGCLVGPNELLAAPSWHFARQHRSYGSQPVEAAEAFLSSEASRLDVEGLDLRADRLFRWGRNDVVRFRLYHEGHEVFGAVAKVMVRPGGAIAVAVIDLPRGWEANAIHPSITAYEAGEIVENMWIAKGAAGYLGKPEPVLGYRVSGGEGSLCYRVLVPVGAKGHLHYVDGVSGKVMHHHPAVIHALGRVYPDNPVATPDTVDATLNNLDVEAGPDNVLEGWGGQLAAYTHVSGTVQEWANIQYEHLAFGDGNGDFLYDATEIHPSFDDAFTEVNLYYHLDRAYTYFTGVHGLSFTRGLTGLANYTENDQPYENAFFTPVSLAEVVIALGQGDQVDYGYDGDVIIHEFGHFVVDTVAQLGYMESYFDEWGRSQMPGGLHEGFADYFSATLTNESVTGEYSLGAYARDLSNHKVCPDDMLGEPHYDGEVAGSATWAIREAVGYETADQLIYGSLTMLTPNATFKDFAEGVMACGQDMVAGGQLTSQQLTEVEAALESRGMLKCGRWLEVSEQENPSCMMVGFDMLAQQFGTTCSQVRSMLSYYVPGPFQFKVIAPQDVSQLRVVFNMDQASVTPGDDLLYRIYVRQGEMVHYRMESFWGQMEFAVPEDFDYESEEFTEPTAEIALTADSSPMLQAGEEYYFAVGYRNCPTTQATFTVTLEEEIPPEPDASVIDAAIDAGDATDAGPSSSGPKDGGCDCRTPSSGTQSLPLAALWLLVCGVLLWRARRRHRAETDRRSPSGPSR
jgi:hypothetical protein